MPWITNRLPWLCLLSQLISALVGADPPAQDRGDLERQVAAAVERGVAALVPYLKNLRTQPRKDYPMGRLAFSLTAAIKAGAPLEHAEIAASLTTLQRMPMKKTYGVSCQLFALDARLGRRGKKDKEAARVRRRMHELVAWLAQAQRPRGGWGYGQDGKDWGDLSNTQFAMLGLAAALANDVPVPKVTIERATRGLITALQPGTKSVSVRLHSTPSFEHLLGLTTRPKARVFRGVPAGWGYRLGTRRTGKKTDAPYAAMTAAGMSSLAIALDALQSMRAGTRSLHKDAGEALIRSQAWAAVNFKKFLADDRDLFYALYSLEKAGDVSSIQRFDTHDWYREGAQRLLALERRPRGGWGGYLKTTYALLFLTRATRRVADVGPRIVTGDDPDGKATQESDLVYVKQAGGFVSARAVLLYMSATRRAKLVRVGQEIVRNFRSDRAGDLVPLLLACWGKKDPITRFAQRSLKTLTGMTSSRREGFVKWHQRYQSVRALEDAKKVTAAEVRKALQRTPGLALRMRLARLAAKHRLRDLTGLFIGEMGYESVEYLRVVHGLLVLLTGKEIAAPASDSAKAWAQVARRWEEWWREREE